MAAATPSPNPTNLLLLAALGIGVYWFMTRAKTGAVAPVIYPTPVQNQQAYGSDTKALKYQLTAGLLGKAFDYFAKPADNPYQLTTQNVSQTFGMGLQLDNVAYNPPDGSSFDNLYSLVR